jgi:hypothetical protein
MREGDIVAMAAPTHEANHAAAVPGVEKGTDVAHRLYNHKVHRRSINIAVFAAFCSESAAKTLLKIVAPPR